MYRRRSSSVVEQGTHKPLVGGSNPPSATNPRRSCDAPAAAPAARINPSTRLSDIQPHPCGPSGGTSGSYPRVDRKRSYTGDPPWVRLSGILRRRHSLE